MSKIIRKAISTPNAGKPGGPYSQAIIADKTMYISGQVGKDPKTGVAVPGGVEEEAKQCLLNMQAILTAAESSMKNVVKTTILLNDISDWPKVNTVYEQFFQPPYPARAAYQAGALPNKFLVEMEAVAVLGEIEDVE